jgi:hypothetical protein
MRGLVFLVWCGLMCMADKCLCYHVIWLPLVRQEHAHTHTHIPHVCRRREETVSFWLLIFGVENFYMNAVSPGFGDPRFCVRG